MNSCSFRVLHLRFNFFFNNFRHTTLAIVVDLSKPSEIWFTLETLLAAAKARVENILTEMKQEYPGLKEKLRKKAWERVGEEHSVSTRDCIQRLQMLNF